MNDGLRNSARNDAGRSDRRVCNSFYGVAMTDNRICAATPRQSLEDQILNENEPKNEREWWACRHIKYLRDEVIAERNVDIEQLRQRVTEKDEVIAEAGEMLAMRDRQLAALKAELREICAAIDDPACDLTLTAVECIKKLKGENKWQPIETAPKDEFVLLAGPSGYTTIETVFTTGRMCSDYHAGRWIDHANDDLTDWGFNPTHWMPLPKPPAIDATILQGEK